MSWRRWTPALRRCVASRHKYANQWEKSEMSDTRSERSSLIAARSGVGLSDDLTTSRRCWCRRGDLGRGLPRNAGPWSRLRRRWRAEQALQATMAPKVRQYLASYSIVRGRLGNSNSASVLQKIVHHGSKKWCEACGSPPGRASYM